MKYYYNGISLSKYCRNNRMNYMVIHQRVYRLKKDNPELSDDEAVMLVMEGEDSYKKVNGNTKYMYEGLSLREYCKKHNISYVARLQKIYSLQRKHPQLSNDEVVKLAIENNISSNTKYVYEGLSLEQYCKNNSLNYHTVLCKIFRLKKDNSELSNDEVVSLAIENKVNGNTKYMYEGLSLREYCKKHSINYNSKLQKIYSLQRTNPQLSNEAVVKLAVENNIPSDTKYIYKGLSLKQYCKKNSLNYHTIFVRISRLKKKNQQIAINELIKIVLENFNDSKIKYMYEGLSLRQYCKDNNIKYETVISRLHKFENDYPDLETNKLIELSLKLKK